MINNNLRVLMTFLEFEIWMLKNLRINFKIIVNYIIYVNYRYIYFFITLLNLFFNWILYLIHLIEILNARNYFNWIIPSFNMNVWYMILMVTPLTKLFTTNSAYERFQVVMNEHMIFGIPFWHEFFFAVATIIHFYFLLLYSFLLILVINNLSILRSFYLI